MRVLFSQEVVMVTSCAIYFGRAELELMLIKVAQETIILILQV